MKKPEKKKDYAIVVTQPTQSNLAYALEFILKDNPNAKISIKPTPEK